MKKIIPPVLFVICIAIMVGLRLVFPRMQFLTLPIDLIGILPFILGLGIAKHGSDIFEKTGTNIETFNDPDILVTDGLYQMSRNPMYLGFLIALLGVAIILGNFLSLVVVIGFFIVTDRWYIQFEEAAMSKKFGEQYAAYKLKTRRWL
ncbi:MAG: isoprenylcysteine carboxylmethyltransferase family protein [Cyanobacteria bacterium SID2]|nr:isoprenylcysteine carboxylmethyltransferase family protein [Cyanobacteria bacterium SID2]MBP0002510.1 isoprenylcysteine carboxylmethyltransferase family protein [Cyanobacteria bacterium SBC]